jgi:hypothetical protein
MGSAMRTSGGIAAAALVMTGTAVAQPAYAREVVGRNSAANGGGIYNAGLPSRVDLITSVVGNDTPNNCAPLGTMRGCAG